MENIKMSDVAKLAGVSKSTVSQYLNKRYSYMGEDTKKRIHDAIQELNYVPNEIARSLTKKRSNVVGIIFSNIASQFTIQLVQAIEHELQKRKIQIMLCNTDNDQKRELQHLEALTAHQVDGMIIFPNRENIEYYQKLYDKNFPLVFVDRMIPELAIPSIILDNEKATWLATEELIRNGHQKIALITFPYKSREQSNRLGRVKGYLKTIKEHQLRLGNSLLYEIRDSEIESTLEEILLQKKEATGLVLTNDTLLERTLLFCKKHGLHIPEDISIIAIDDTTFSRFTTPTITTVSQPVAEIGIKSTEVLLELLDEKTDMSLIKENLIVEFPPNLIVRESVNNINNKKLIKEVKND